jgi:hypothetical protein
VTGPTCVDSDVPFVRYDQILETEEIVPERAIAQYYQLKLRE